MRRITLSQLILGAITIMVFIYLCAPLVIIIGTAFGESEFVSFPPVGFSLKWFGIALSQSEFLQSLGLSFMVGLVVAGITCVLSVLASLAIVRGKFKGNELATMALLSPLLVPTVVAGLGLMQVFAYMGLLGTLRAVLIAYVIITIPYVTRLMVGGLQGVGESVEEAALVMGATKMQTFFRVTLPMMSRGIMAGYIFAFVIAFDEAVIIHFIAGPGTTTFPLRLFSYIAQKFDPVASAYSSLIMVLTLIAMIVIDRWLGLDKLSKVIA